MGTFVDLDLVQERLPKTIAALEESLAILNRQRPDNIKIGELETALCEVLALDQMADILGWDVDASYIIRTVADFNFARLRPEKLAELRFEESIIPAGVPILLTEAEVKLKGEIWVIHKNDADPFPSNPHAHNYKNQLKMHLGTGDLYQKRARTPYGRMPRKQLLEFRQRLTQRHATIPLPPLVI